MHAVRITKSVEALTTLSALEERLDAAGNLTFESAQMAIGVPAPNMFSELTLVYKKDGKSRGLDVQVLSLP